MLLLHLKRLDPILTTRKADGTHIRVTKKEDEVRIFGRPKDSGIPEYTNRLIEVTEAAAEISGDYEMVGEAVVYDENGRTWFEGSQRRCSTQDPGKQLLYRSQYPVVFLSFDLTNLDGKDLTSLPWEQRKEILHRLLEESTNKSIEYLPYVLEDKREFFNEVVEKGEEGVILKKLGSPYVRTRSPNWLKVKKWYHERCLVVGYTEGTGKREKLWGSLVLAQADQRGYLKYVGQVGSGFNDAEIKHIYNLLREAEIDNQPVDAGEPYTPVNLDLEVTVKFYEMSKNNVFRFPSMLKDAQGNNMIHYGRTIQGMPRQMSLKDLLSGAKA